VVGDRLAGWFAKGDALDRTSMGACALCAWVWVLVFSKGQGLAPFSLGQVGP